MSSIIAFLKRASKDPDDIKLVAAGTFVFLAGIVLLVVTIVRLALGVAAPDEALRIFSSLGLVAIGAMVYAMVAVTQPDGPYMRERRRRIKQHLDGLPPEERERIRRGGIPKDSYLHPDHLPYDRCKPGSFD